MKNIIVVGHIGVGRTTLQTSLEKMGYNVKIAEPESEELESIVKERGVNLVKKDMPILPITNPYEGLQQHYEPHQYNNRKGRRLKNKKK